MNTKTENELIEDFYVSQGGKPSLKADLSFYESSWDMLMPVVEKIEGLYDGTSIRIRIVGDRAVCYDTQTAQQANIYSGEGVGIISSARNEPSKIIAVYKAVVEFIKWHNQQKQ